MQLSTLIGMFLNNYITTTRKSYTYPLNRMRDHMGPARDITEITPAHAHEYRLHIMSLVDEGYFTLKTAEKHIKTVKTFFNWCHKMEFIPASPMRVVKTPRVPRRISRDKAITDEEVRLLLDYTRINPRNRAIIYLLADSGCRAGGACNLKIKDLNLEEMYFITTEKGSKRNRYAFGEDCARALRVWLIQRPPVQVDNLFITRTGKPLTANYLSHMIRRACVAIRDRFGDNIRELSAHSFRHRLGHKLADAHVPPAYAATALNHESVMTYLEHYAPSDYDTAAEYVRSLSISNATPKEEKPIIKLRKTN